MFHNFFALLYICKFPVRSIDCSNLSIMATALAHPGGLGTEFLSSRLGHSLSSKQKSTFVTLNPRRSGFAISSRSAAFLCVAFAGNPGSQGGGQGSSESAKGTKKKPYFRKKRSATKKKKNEEGVAAASVKNDLRALLSNSAVPVFSKGFEASEELEIPQLSTDDDDDSAEDAGIFTVSKIMQEFTIKRLTIN